jgi:hypothetical protein
MSGSESGNSEDEAGSADMDFNLDPEQIENQDPDQFWDEVTKKAGSLKDELKDGMYTYDQARELGLLDEEDSKD